MSHMFVSLKDHVYNYISEQIGNGNLKPDQKINEQQISEYLNISRTPVREALIHLAAEGYIENIPRKGFIVRPLEQKRASELYRIIGSLEALAISDALDHMTDQMIQEMKGLVDRMYEAITGGQVELYYQFQNEFHNRYIDVSANTELAILLRKLKKNFIRQGYAVSGTEDICNVLRSTNDEHARMAALFEARDKGALMAYVQNVHWRSEQTTYDVL